MLVSLFKRLVSAAFYAPLKFFLFSETVMGCLSQTLTSCTRQNNFLARFSISTSLRIPVFDASSITVDEKD